MIIIAFFDDRVTSISCILTPLDNAMFIGVFMYQGLAMIGEKVGMLTVISELPSNKYRDKMRLCKCDCGKERIVRRRVLAKGAIKNCGCVKTHGKFHTPTWRSWKAMKTRCNSPSSAGYHNYGGRGITVCDRWLNSFENFLEDMGEKEHSRIEIDRIDNNGNYEPSNCRWVTRKVNDRNRRTNVLITFKGKTLALVEWAEVYGLNPGTVYSRMVRGLPVELMLSKTRIPRVDADKRRDKNYIPVPLTLGKCVKIHNKLLQSAKAGGKI